MATQDVERDRAASKMTEVYLINEFLFPFKNEVGNNSQQNQQLIDSHVNIEEERLTTVIRHIAHTKHHTPHT